MSNRQPARQGQLWFKTDTEVFEHPGFVVLTGHSEAYFWWWTRLMQFARRTCSDGLVLRGDGFPVNARDLALVHHRDLERVDEWETFLDICCREDLLAREPYVGGEDVYRVLNWTRYYFKPSDAPEATRERKQRQRDRQREGVTVQNVTPVTRVTICHTGHATDPDPDTYTDPDSCPSSSELVLTPVKPSVERTENEQILKDVDGRKKNSIISFGERCLKRLSPTAAFGKQQGKELLAFFEQNRGSPTQHGSIVNSDLQDALVYAVESTMWRTNSEKIDNRWKYMLTTAQEKLAAAVEWRSDREFAKSHGHADIGPFRFKEDA